MGSVWEARTTGGFEDEEPPENIRIVMIIAIANKITAMIVFFLFSAPRFTYVRPFINVLIVTANRT